MSRADARHLIAESFRKNLLGITFNKMFEILYKGIDELPPVTPTQRWIPVSERLPKKTGWYFVTFNVCGNKRAVCELSYRKPENYWTDKNISRKILDNSEVLAWQPLPQPYEEKRGDSDGSN